MDAALPGAVVEGYEKHIPGLTLPDPDDRHVLAAAIEAEAEVVVTFNTADFPRLAIAQYGIEVRRPDALVLDLAERHPEELYAVARAHRSALRKPPLTVEQYLDQLGRAGLKRTAEHLRQVDADL